VGKVNVDDSPEIASRFGVRGIPTLIYSRTARSRTDGRREPEVQHRFAGAEEPLKKGALLTALIAGLL